MLGTEGGGGGWKKRAIPSLTSVDFPAEAEGYHFCDVVLDRSLEMWWIYIEETVTFSEQSVLIH